MVGVARLIVNRRALCHHSRSVRVRAPSLHRHYPASLVVRTHPPSEAADAGPRGFVVGLGSWPFPRRQTSLVAHCPCSVRAATITPVGPPAAYLARFPGGVGLPRYSGGSAPTLALSRPAQCSLALRPARSADLQKRPFLRVLQTIRRLLIRPECFRLEREFAGPVFHRGEQCTLARRTKQSGGEFASSGAPARAQDATLQISGIGATLSERSCRRPQYLQPPAPSRLPVDASDLPIRSGGAMAQRDQRGMTTVRAPPYSD